MGTALGSVRLFGIKGCQYFYNPTTFVENLPISVARRLCEWYETLCTAMRSEQKYLTL